MPFGADLACQVVALNRLVLALAAVYGDPESGRARTAGVAARPGRPGSGPSRCARASCACCAGAAPRRSGRARTVAGALAGGALGYAAALAVGRFAQSISSARPLGRSRRGRR